MGCDIHIYGEYKYTPKFSTVVEKVLSKEKPEWVTFERWDDDEFEDYRDEYPEGTFLRDVEYHERLPRWRDYEMFEALAGVRGSDEKMLLGEPKGIPEDACFEIKGVYERSGRDTHTPSWHTLRELKTVDWESLYHRRSFMHELIPLLESQARVLGVTEDEIRIVYWFDN